MLLYLIRYLYIYLKLHNNIKTQESLLSEKKEISPNSKVQSVSLLSHFKLFAKVLIHLLPPNEQVRSVLMPRTG